MISVALCDEVMRQISAMVWCMCATMQRSHCPVISCDIQWYPVISSDCPESTREELEKNSLYSHVFPVESFVGFLCSYYSYWFSFLQCSGQAIAFYSGEEPEKKETKRRLGWVVTNFNYLIKWEASVGTAGWDSGFQCFLFLEWCYDSYDQIISRLVDLLHTLGHAGHHQCSSPFIRICRCDRCDPALRAPAEPFTNRFRQEISFRTWWWRQPTWGAKLRVSAGNTSLLGIKQRTSQNTV